MLTRETMTMNLVFVLSGLAGICFLSCLICLAIWGCIECCDNNRKFRYSHLPVAEDVEELIDEQDILNDIKHERIVAQYLDRKRKIVAAKEIFLDVDQRELLAEIDRELQDGSSSDDAVFINEIDCDAAKVDENKTDGSRRCGTSCNRENVLNITSGRKQTDANKQVSDERRDQDWKNAFGNRTDNGDSVKSPKLEGLAPKDEAIELIVTGEKKVDDKHIESSKEKCVNIEVQSGKVGMKTDHSGTPLKKWSPLEDITEGFIAKQDINCRKKLENLQNVPGNQKHLNGTAHVHDNNQSRPGNYTPVRKSHGELRKEKGGIKPAHTPAPKTRVQKSDLVHRHSIAPVSQAMGRRPVTQVRPDMNRVASRTNSGYNKIRKPIRPCMKRQTSQETLLTSQALPVHQEETGCNGYYKIAYDDN